jgi:hypothetical protein
MRAGHFASQKSANVYIMSIRAFAALIGIGARARLSPAAGPRQRIARSDEFAR